MAEQTTLILLKPDCVASNRCGEVLKRFESAGLKIAGIQMIALNDAVLREHYAHIADRPFFPEVVAFMTRTPVIAAAIRGENAIDCVRDLLGPTDSKKAPAGTIRGDFGIDVMQNMVHASDSADAAAAEIQRFFPNGGIY